MQDHKVATIAPGIELILDPTGVFLSFGPVLQGTAEDVCSFVKEQRLGGISVASIQDAFRRRAAGKVLLGQSDQVQCADAEAEIVIGEQGLTATLVYSREGFGGVPLRREKLMALLAKNAIIHGIDMVLVERILSGEIASGSYTIATGTVPVDGMTAVLNYEFGKQKKRNTDRAS